MLLYIVKLSLAWSFFALLYTVFLRRETFFRANRAYLLGTMALGILLAIDTNWVMQLQQQAGVPVFELPVFTVGLQQVNAVAKPWIWLDYLWVIYFFGAGLALLRMCWGLLKILKMAAQGDARRQPDGVVFIHTEAVQVPFSFFKWIFIPPDFEESHVGKKDALESMLCHERAHAQGWHSIDVLAAELLCIVFWFHPLVHWYRRALRTVHEYLADAEASRQTNLKQYGLLLIRQAHSGMSLALVNHFFQSPLKQRLLMLTQKASAPIKTLKYGLLLPVTALFVMLFQQAPVIAQQIDSEHLKRIKNLEANNWMETDTVTTFDSETSKETVQLVHTNFSPYKDASGRTVYQITEKQAEFPGGQSELFKFLIQNIHYPDAARKAKAEDMVVLKFVVDADGSISKVEKKGDKAIRQDFIDEAIRVVKLMPKWTPAEQKGKKVASEMVLPIKFKLG